MKGTQIRVMKAQQLIYLATSKYNEAVNLQMKEYLGQVDPESSEVRTSDDRRIVTLNTSDGITVAMYEVTDDGFIEL